MWSTPLVVGHPKKGKKTKNKQTVKFYFVDIMSKKMFIIVIL